ncbi:IFRD2 regulator, partial [Atlantisia rogersi]|nr:IFRD2 regulator [Atlantisia rogersi]
GSEAACERVPEEEAAEDRLKEHMDSLLDRSAKTRQAALRSLRLAFSCRSLSELLLERRLSLADSLEKCLRKGGGAGGGGPGPGAVRPVPEGSLVLPAGKGEEQALAGTVLTLLCLQMGSGPEGEELFRSLKPLLTGVLADSTGSPSARQSCAMALGVCCYIAAADLE